MPRYLTDVVQHLRSFVDEIVVLDDASDDGTSEWLEDHRDDQLIVERNAQPSFFVHEGRCRQRLIDIVLARPTDFVLSCDLDEFVSDGAALRARLEAEPDVGAWSLDITEVWKADDQLWTREDGGWRTHPLTCLWKAPPPGQKFTMLDRKLACRRVPQQVLAQKAKPTGVSLLHFGWANPSERQQRYDRYTKHDGGKFHASSHLRSIMWPEERMRFDRRPWPEGQVFDGLRERLAPVTA